MRLGNAMRYCPHSVDYIKSKAKLLKRYLSNPLMEAPTLSLTDIQQIIARGLGYMTWAEMMIEIARSTNDARNRVSFVVPDKVFGNFVKVLSTTLCRSEDLCAALIFRLGFCPCSPDLSFSTEAPSLSEQCLFFDVILDRFLELDPASLDYVAARTSFLDLHRKLLKEHISEWQRWDARVGNFQRGTAWNQRERLLDWVGATINMTAHPEPQLVQRTVDCLYEAASKKALLKYRMLSPNRLIAPFEQGKIPSAGLLVMTGGNGSGRTFSSIMLTLANRRSQRTLFPTFLRLYNEPFAGGLPQGYLGELRNLEDFKEVVRDAEKQLVIIQLGAGGPESAYDRTCDGLRHAMGPSIKDWVRQNFIGGYHHEFGERNQQDKLRNSIVTFWKATDAQYVDGSGKTVEVDTRTEL
jgi:hypothetical protein